MIDTTIKLIDRLLSAVGKTVSLLVLAMIALITLEMIMRGVFERPSPWAHELSAWLLTAFIFLGGPYALIKNQFVRVDVIFERFSPKVQALVDTVVSTTALVLFAGVLVWLGGRFAYSSYLIGERSAAGGWDGPLWLAKFMIPVGAGLLCLGWLSHLLRAWRTALRQEG